MQYYIYFVGNFNYVCLKSGFKYERWHLIFSKIEKEINVLSELKGKQDTVINHACVVFACTHICMYIHTYSLFI